MRRLIGLTVCLVLLAASNALLTPRLAEGSTGPYTLPFYLPTIGVTQPYGCTGYLAEPPYGSCAHYHNGIDYSTGTKPVAAALGGKVLDKRENLQDTTTSYPACASAPFDGNYVWIDHGNGKYTIYYHLSYQSVTVSVGQTVWAGQKIGDSGNSGRSCGAHLHYQLTTSGSSMGAAGTLNPEGRWTTDPGRVPYRAKLVSTSPSGTQYIHQGSTASMSVTLKNTGGRTWTQTNPTQPAPPAFPVTDTRRIFFASSNSDGDASRTSAAQGSDWVSTWQVTVANQTSVAPDANGVFTFELDPPWAQGVQRVEYFNLYSDGLRWFKLQNASGTTIDSLAITIEMLPPLCACVEP